MNPDVVEKIRLYFSERPEVIAVYPFGSHARGYERQDSDIDLGVLLVKEILSRQRKLETAYIIGLGKLLRKDFHIVIMNDAGEGILAQIFKRGRCPMIDKSLILAKASKVERHLGRVTEKRSVRQIAEMD